MAVDPRLVTIAPDESNRVISNRLDVCELEVPSLDELDRPLMTLAVCTGAEAAQKLVRIHTSVAVCPVDFHDASPAGRAELDGFRGIGQQMRPSQPPEDPAVRFRTVTVAWCASSSASASRISWRSAPGHACSGSSELACTATQRRSASADRTKRPPPQARHTIPPRAASNEAERPWAGILPQRTQRSSVGAKPSTASTRI